MSADSNTLSTANSQASSLDLARLFGGRRRCLYVSRSARGGDRHGWADIHPPPRPHRGAQSPGDGRRHGRGRRVARRLPGDRGRLSAAAARRVRGAGLRSGGRGAAAARAGRSGRAAGRDPGHEHHGLDGVAPHRAARDRGRDSDRPVQPDLRGAGGRRGRRGAVDSRGAAALSGARPHLVTDLGVTGWRRPGCRSRSGSTSSGAVSARRWWRASRVFCGPASPGRSPIGRR